MNTLTKSLFKTSGALWGATTSSGCAVQASILRELDHKVDRNIYREIYKVMPDVESPALSRVIEASIHRK